METNKPSSISSVLDDIQSPSEAWALSPCGEGLTATHDEQHFEILRRDQIIREKDGEIARLEDEHRMRKTFLHLVFWFVVGFTLLSLAIVVFSKLKDCVKITLLTSTTAEVIGILLIAFAWLFPKR